MLHGRAASAGMMRELVEGTGWADALDGCVEFVYCDAVHACAPQPHLYPQLAERGAYGEQPTFDWGFGLPELHDDERVVRQTASITSVASKSQSNF